MDKPRLVGINHVALEVGDIEEALAFYGRIFTFTLRGKGKTNAFIDMGDQFINLTRPAREHRDSPRHFGLVVDDRRPCPPWSRRRAGNARRAVPRFPGSLGNRVEVVAYRRHPVHQGAHVLRGMGLTLEKTEKARRELAEKGMAPEPA